MRRGDTARECGAKAEEYVKEQLSKFGEVKVVNVHFDLEFNGIPIEVKSAQLAIKRTEMKPRCSGYGWRVDIAQYHHLLAKKPSYYALVIMVGKEIIYLAFISSLEAVKHFSQNYESARITRIRFDALYDFHCKKIEDFVESVRKIGGSS